MSKPDDPEAKKIDNWFKSLRIKYTNHMDKKGNYTRPPK